ncbi:Two-component response regulator arr2 [Thalictrum thalictroides]|uniref:Two-component response regulator arr2 n=1 Tax=Thalictrum thalictroides TaxID=46969 RepID=A0A7J6VSJ5_THATH|nr:Two-component response regulator arr2 [Thalictrum thalictroides]
MEGHSEEEAGSSKTISGSSTRSDAFVGLQVLVVDDDEVNLKILKALLSSYKHEVVTVSRPTDALNVLHERDGGFDLVITDIHMPIMNGFDLLQIIKKDFKNIPVIMISSENSNELRSKALQRGACHYQPKPICESFFQNIWQYVFCKQPVNNQRSLEAEGSVQDEASSRQKLIRRESIEISSSAINVKNWRQQENKRKRKPREYDDDDDDYEDEDRDDFPAPKKTRMVWTPKLHERFMQAINKIGHEKAVPRKIREVMDVPGVSRTNIASHLQKYRLYLKSNKDPNQSRRSFRNSRYYTQETRTSGYAPSYNSSMSYKSPQGFAQFPEKQQSQFASYQPAWGSNFVSLNNALNMPSVGQTRSYNQGLSNGSFMAQPRCGYPTQMFSNTPGNLGQQPFLSSAPNYLNQQHVSSQQTFGMGTSLDGDNFSYREGDPIMHQFFPDAPVEQQKFSNADFQGQSNLQSFETIDFMNLAPDANLADNNSSNKSNYVGFQLSNNEGVIGLRQTGMDSVEDSTVVNVNVNQMDEIGNGMMPMEGIDTSPLPNFDSMNFNPVTPVGSNFTGAFANSNAFETAPLITAMDQLQLQPNDGGGILENWCDLIRNNSTNDLNYLLSNNGGSQQNQACRTYTRTLRVFLIDRSILGLFF